MATITSPRPQSPASSARTPQLTQSPSLTPASSARASFDLLPGARASSPAANATATAVNPAQRRNRAALRDYYNLKAKTAPPGTTSNDTTTVAAAAGASSSSPQAPGLSRTTSTASSGTTNTTTTTTADNPLPPDIDTATFSPSTYVTTLLSTGNLKTILRTEATLISEIRTLDGERKALVYDNYSKLIEATKTIGTMQRGMAEGVGKGRSMEMESLAPALEGVVKLAAGLAKTDGHMQTGGREEGEEEEENGEEEELQRRLERRKKEAVRWVVGAPARFEVYAESGRNEEMGGEWKDIERALAKWEGVKGVSEIRARCLEIMGDVNDKS